MCMGVIFRVVAVFRTGPVRVFFDPWSPGSRTSSVLARGCRARERVDRKVGRHWRCGIRRYWIPGGALAVRPAAADRTTRTSTRTTRSNGRVAPPHSHVINPAAIGPIASSYGSNLAGRAVVARPVEQLYL